MQNNRGRLDSRGGRRDSRGGRRDGRGGRGKETLGWVEGCPSAASVGRRGQGCMHLLQLLPLWVSGTQLFKKSFLGQLGEFYYGQYNRYFYLC